MKTPATGTSAVRSPSVIVMVSPASTPSCSDADGSSHTPPGSEAAPVTSRWDSKPVFVASRTVSTPPGPATSTADVPQIVSAGSVSAGSPAVDASSCRSRRVATSGESGPVLRDDQRVVPFGGEADPQRGGAGLGDEHRRRSRSRGQDRRRRRDGHEQRREVREHERPVQRSRRGRPHEAAHPISSRQSVSRRSSQSPSMFTTSSVPVPVRTATDVPSGAHCMPA